MPMRPPSYRPPMAKAKTKPKRDNRPNSWARGYDDTWRNLRKLKLANNPLCESCGRPAKEVDHIIPINDGGERLDMDNLQSLCKPCHSRKTVVDRYKRK